MDWMTVKRIVIRNLGSAAARWHKNSLWATHHSQESRLGIVN